MKDKTYDIEISGTMTKADWRDQLEKVAAASHALMEVGLRLQMECNSPDMQALFQCAGSANVALYYAKQIALGNNPPPASGPRIQ